ncbi:ubiquitin carboxyl-terminal hydrolase [Podospora australis]|uniref:ubiquitinyl hydrolase 1 n=1 Tax=Podospora australis TaxID=1536484 RepID=A0AAN6X153_9PEZI|nr:ubiquitin carboxyl-terminal hydrolase [Podospora australis]
MESVRGEGDRIPPGSVQRPGPFKRFWNAVRAFIKPIDDRINGSLIGRFFRLKGSGPNAIPDANFSTELRAGLTTFATMAYIIAVNSSILADTGFDCYCEKPLDLQGNCQNKDEWTICYDEVKMDLITATAAVAAFSSFLFGLATNLPVCLAPGMGLNAYFTYQVVGAKGSGSISYRLALTAVFIEGFIFLFLALTGMRHWLVKIIPGTIKTASGVGIGLFLTLIGMSYASGIGIITGAISTPLAIGGCPAEYLSATGECDRGIMTSPKMWIGIALGGLLTVFLMAFRVRAAIVIGIALVSILSWPRNTSVTYFPDTPDGNRRFDFFKQIVSFHPIKHTLFQQEWDLSGETGSRFIIALITFLYVDIIDCTATMYSMARFCSRVRGNEKDFPRSTLAFSVDAICVSLGSLVGCSPVTTFIESGAGIAEGGRTGLTAIVAGFCFFISIFFAPIFASIPPWATGSTLMLVGCLMIRQVSKINWAYIGDAVPSFITLAFIPFTYSVAYGLIAGIFSYVGINLCIWVVIKLSGDTVVPKNYELKEYWTWKPPGEKPWIYRMVVRFIFWLKRLKNNRNSTFQLASASGDENSSTGHARSPNPSPAVMDEGVQNVQFEELLSLDPSALAELYPIYGVIFLFKYPTDVPYRSSTGKPLDGEFDYGVAESDLFFATQTIPNACGTQALLSVLLNKTSDLEIGPVLRDFRDFAIALPAEIRGEVLSNSDVIRDVHNSFSKSSPFVDETQRNPDAEAEDAFHFIAYTTYGGKLYELDGLQPAPISHGPCESDQEFPEKVMEVIQRRIARYEAAEIRFNLLAMVRDLRIRARELGDEELLEREERKRKEWQFENALRKHNFVGFAGEVMKGVVEQKLKEGDGAYEKWVEQGKEKMRRRVEERKKVGGGGGDVEMEG